MPGYIVSYSLTQFLLSSSHHINHFDFRTVTNSSKQVTLKPDVTDEQVAAAKKHAVDQGGKIGHEYTIFKGFSYVAYFFLSPPSLLYSY